MSEPPNIRQELEAGETNLSPQAAKSSNTRGRQYREEPCPVRTEYQRDRDRIIHCKSFRRLKHKTQVFIAPPGDHFVTRLTHTLEVAQIARTIARALGLNEDLTESIALGHDLGHTPFGHIGESALDELVPGGFRHNEQSRRIVDLLEKDGRGLNLTWEVRDGILHHSKARADICGEGGGQAETLEGEVCRLADAIAYINHDIGDAIRAGVITDIDLPREAVSVLGQRHSRRINTMVLDVITSSKNVVNAGGKGAIMMSPGVLAAANILREFLFTRVYEPHSVGGPADEARKTVKTLYRHFSLHSEGIPGDFFRHGDDAAQWATDYIAGMTDHFAAGLALSL